MKTCSCHLLKKLLFLKKPFSADHYQTSFSRKFRILIVVTWK